MAVQVQVRTHIGHLMPVCGQSMMNTESWLLMACLKRRHQIKLRWVPMQENQSNYRETKSIGRFRNTLRLTVGNITSNLSAQDV